MLESLACRLLLLVAALSSSDGAIDGVVVNGTRECTADGVTVVLRAPVDGEFVVLAEATTDADGRFRFDGLPLDAPGPFLPGANLDGIHFPGPRTQLASDMPHVSVQLVVFESTTGPSPLEIERHEMTVTPKRGSILVRETMLICNPTPECYVGCPRHEGGGPVTLELGIPSSFERVTFDQEAFGRQFRLLNAKLVTGIPWPPGKRELSFQYVLPTGEAEWLWTRRVDLPSRDVRLNVEGSAAEQTICNLPLVSVSATASGSREDPTSGAVTFAGDQLEGGTVIRLQFERLPVPLEVYGRRAAVLVLLALVAGVTVSALARGAS